jgi:hypothetical protein
MGWKDLLFGQTRTRTTSRSVVIVNGQAVGGTTGAGVKGKGPSVAQVRAGLEGFDRVDTSIMCDMTIRVGTEGSPTHDLRADDDASHPFRVPAGGAEFRVTVTAPENLQKIVRTEVRGDTLHIDTTESYQSDEPMQIEIDVPKLAGLTSSGHGRVDVSGVHGSTFVLDHSGMGAVTVDGRVDHLAADISGHGKVWLLGFVTPKIVLNHSGMGALTLRGRTESLVVTLSGHGAIDLGECPTPWLHLMASGMGRVTVHCTGAAKGYISGHGSTQVLGSPSDWKVKHSGVGSVNFV